MTVYFLVCIQVIIQIIYCLGKWNREKQLSSLKTELAAVERYIQFLLDAENEEYSEEEVTKKYKGFKIEKACL